MDNRTIANYTLTRGLTEETKTVFLVLKDRYHYGYMIDEDVVHTDDETLKRWLDERTNVYDRMDINYYNEIDYYDEEDKRTYGDMGYSICDREESKVPAIHMAEANAKLWYDTQKDEFDDGDIPVFSVISKTVLVKLDESGEEEDDIEAMMSYFIKAFVGTTEEKAKANGLADYLKNDYKNIEYIG